jgi:RHS repeat-associated protein
MMGAIVTIDESNGSKITITLNDESLLMEVSRWINSKLSIDCVDGTSVLVDRLISWYLAVLTGRQCAGTRGDWVQRGVQPMSDVQARFTRLLGIDQHASVLLGIAATGVHSRGYCAYGGHPLVAADEVKPGFNGNLPDALTGWYLLGNGYRAYSPALMRFVSPDNVSPFGAGGVNAYGYCGGDPVNLEDPSGHLGWMKFFGTPFRRVGRLLGIVSKKNGTLGAGTMFKPKTRDLTLPISPAPARVSARPEAPLARLPEAAPDILPRPPVPGPINPERVAALAQRRASALSGKAFQGYEPASFEGFGRRNLSSGIPESRWDGSQIARWVDDVNINAGGWAWPALRPPPIARRPALSTIKEGRRIRT